MSQILAVSIQRLLEGSGVESQRVEFKASWEPNTVGRQVLRTICAFANDYHNLNGGYVVIGAGEADGHAILPPCGIDPSQSRPRAGPGSFGWKHVAWRRIRAEGSGSQAP